MKEVPAKHFETLDRQTINSEKELGTAVGHIETDDVDALAAVGAEFAIGGLNVPSNPFGVVLLLEAIESPFIMGDDDLDEDADPPARDVALAFYVLALGVKALNPIMALSRRKRALEATKEIARTSPEFFKVYLAQVDLLERTFAEMEADAFEFIEKSEIESIDEAADFVHQMLANMFLAAKAMPASDGDEKKTDSE